jgi:hypothetical protein
MDWATFLSALVPSALSRAEPESNSTRTEPVVAGSLGAGGSEAVFAGAGAGGAALAGAAGGAADGGVTVAAGGGGGGELWGPLGGTGGIGPGVDGRAAVDGAAGGVAAVTAGGVGTGGGGGGAADGTGGAASRAAVRVFALADAFGLALCVAALCVVALLDLALFESAWALVLCRALPERLARFDVAFGGWRWIRSPEVARWLRSTGDR